MDATSVWSAGPVIDWILHKARHLSDPQAMLGGICDRVAAAGMPLARVNVFIRTLHPQYFGFVISWKDGTTDLSYGEHEQQNTDTYRHSPVTRIIEGERVIRRRLSGPAAVLDYSVLHELREAGFTDYVVVELVFSTGTRNAVSLATRAPDGFGDHDIREVQRLLHLFALLMENHANRGIAANLMNTYLGSISGARVLDGKIRRGEGDYIDAVIWFSDLRDSTPLAESLGRARYLSLLNDYFEATAGAVLAHGGEVLRFIGDASLAVFPIECEAHSSTVCARAVGAAREARERVMATNTERRGRAEPPFAFGLGLHRGEVLYGNIGTAHRLEFSVVGPAANETARIETLTKSVGADVVASEEVVRHLPPGTSDDWRSLGQHRLRGVGKAIEVFALS